MAEIRLSRTNELHVDGLGRILTERNDFPLLEHAIRAAVGPTVTIVDSATTTAERVAKLLDEQHLHRTATDPPTLTLLATDGAERFARVGARFLGEEIEASDIEIVDL